MSDQWGPPGQFPPPPPGQYPPPPPPPPGPAPSFPPAGGPPGRVVWPWVLGGLAVVLLVAAGVFVATRGDDDGSTVTDSERDTTTTDRPSTTTTSEAPSTTATSTSGPGVSVFPDQLRVADCFDDSGIATPGEVSEISRVECGMPHDAEVYALVTLAGEADAPYPGDEKVADMSDQLCLDQFAPYVGVEYLDSKWEFGYYTPIEESWRKFDDRGVICYLVDPEFGKIEGSQRGTGT